MRLYMGAESSSLILRNQTLSARMRAIAPVIVLVVAPVNVRSWKMRDDKIRCGNIRSMIIRQLVVSEIAPGANVGATIS